jgi:catechol 2,3-dioxygenase-like lactoylglutathione lyase family enzyme
MVNGSHVIFYAKDADKVRSFFKDVLKLGSVDAGHGWLIFALPPAEFAVHPTDDKPHYELYLMCDNLQETMKDLQVKGVEFAHPLKEERWGLVTAIQLPGGGDMGLYEPRHPTALKLNC